MLGRVSRVCHGQILIMILAAQHSMSWDAETNSAGSPADTSCNHALWRFCGAAGLQSSNFGELWLPVVLQLQRTNEGERVWWEICYGQDMIMPLAAGYGMAWAVELSGLVVDGSADLTGR